MESALAIGFRAGGGCCLTRWNCCYGRAPSKLLGGRRCQRFHGASLECHRSLSSHLHRNNGRCCSTMRARSSSSSSKGQNYHPSEEMGERPPQQDARLTDAETTRTIIEVNSKATLMFSVSIDDEVHESVIWSDLHYLTDENGDIYFEVKDEDLLQTLVAEDKLVQVIIGIDNVDLLAEMEEFGPSNFDFAAEDITNEDSDMDDDYEEDLVTVLEDEDGDMIDSEDLSNWSNLETLKSSHPMHFARRMTEVVSSTHFDWMEQPSASIVVQGLLRPAFVEEHTFDRKHPVGHNASKDQKKHHEEIMKDNTEEQDIDHKKYGGTTFYKLEMINIQLLSAYGSQTVVKVQDFRKAEPDIIAHSAMNIISRMRAIGDTTTEALKSLCWRHKGLLVEEAVLAGMDSLGFDMRVCAGTQVQTLRFAFNTRATSEVSAEKQLRDLLFPRVQSMPQKWQQQAQQKEG